MCFVPPLPFGNLRNSLEALGSKEIWDNAEVQLKVVERDGVLSFFFWGGGGHYGVVDELGGSTQTRRQNCCFEKNMPLRLKKN